LGQALPVARSGLASEDHRVRIAAIRLIAELNAPDLIELVQTHTRDPEAPVRVATARALGAMGGRRAQDDLRRLMGDSEPSVREAAAVAAADARLGQLLPALLQLLGDDNERVRRSAGQAIGILGERSVVPDLLRAFEDANPDVREVIILAVGRVDLTALTSLVDTLAGSPDVRSKLTLARSLGKLRPPGAIELLPRLLRDPDSEVRVAAMQALGRCARFVGPAPEALAREVNNGLSDPDEVVRASAINTCSRLCLHDRARTLLSLVQTDASALARERAALAIGAMRIQDGEQALIAACRRAEPANVRAAAALATAVFHRDSLVTLVVEMPDGSSVRELLHERLKNDAWFRLLSRKLSRAKNVELYALAATGSEDAQRSLADGMRSILDAGERVRLISGLRAFHGEHSRSALLQMVRSDPSPEVRTAALTAVGEMLDPDELLAFGSRALGDPSIMVRRAAVGLFAKVPPTRAFPRLIQALRLDDDPVVLAAAAGLAEEQFPAFREAAVAAELADRRLVLIARLSRYIHHPELSGLLPQLSRSSAPEVREAVAEVWRHRPDAADPVSLEALAADPVSSVRHAAAGAAAAAERYDLLDRMTQDPDPGVRREVAIVLGRAAPVSQSGLLVLERLQSDPEMPVRAAAYIARLLQGIPVPLPPGIDARVAAEAVGDAADRSSLRSIARTAAIEDERLAAALTLALVQDEVAREVARTDPAPAIRHRVGGALELSMATAAGKSS
jgi:HEAT repeat protein